MYLKLETGSVEESLITREGREEAKEGCLREIIQLSLINIEWKIYCEEDPQRNLIKIIDWTKVYKRRR